MNIGNLVFLSYRRLDTTPHALAIKLELEAELRAAQVFIDMSIQGAETWPSRIGEALQGAALVMPIIGPNWAGKGKIGSRPIDREDDWVRKEVRFALSDKPAKILPVLIDATPPLRMESLPNDLRPLASIQALRVTIEHWEASVGQLVDQVCRNFGFERKANERRYPLPHSMIAKTMPVPWTELSQTVREHLPRWSLEFSDDEKQVNHKRVELTATFDFASFSDAIRFITLVADHARVVQHHPRWSNVWRSVTFWLTTWDAGHRVTSLDTEFAQVIERMYRSFLRDSKSQRPRTTGETPG